MAEQIKPNKQTQQKIMQYVKECVSRGSAVVAERASSWQLLDECLNCYVHLSEVEKKRKQEDSKAAVSIIFPFSLTALETLVSQCTNAFYNTPMYPCTPQSKADRGSAAMLTHILQFQANKFRHYLSHNIVFRNAWAYGIGVGVPSWDKITGTRTVYNEMTNEVEEVDGTFYEGNKITAIDPYSMIIDPSFSAHDLSKSSYFGWVEQIPKNALLRLAESRDYLNKDKLKDISQPNHVLTLNTRRQAGIGGRNTKRAFSSTTLNPIVDVVKLMVDIVPSSVGLTGDTPERYVITSFGTDILLEATPLNVFYDEFPATPCCPTYDGYSPLPLGKIESIQGMQDLLDFLFNSHMGNVRKSINDTLLIDPSLVNVNDLLNRQNGGIVRMRKKHWGSGADVKAVQQLQVYDVTRTHINDAMFILQQMAQVTGTDETTMGGLRQGGPERLTQTEYLGTKQQGAARMDHLLGLMALQYWNPIATKMGVHSQQLMSEDVEMELLEGFDQLFDATDMQISMKDINIPFDVSFSPKGSNIMSQNMLTLFRTVAESPTLQQSFDVPRIFEDLLRSYGMKDVRQYRMQVTPDAQVQQEAQAGNMVPLEEAMSV